MVDAMEVDEGQASSPKPASPSSEPRPPVQSVEGWVILLTNVHEEAAEEDFQDLLADFGPVRNLQLNLDRRTGYVKGYALAEYAKRSEAEACLAEAKRGALKVLGQVLDADFAFTSPPEEASAAAVTGGKAKEDKEGERRGPARRDRSRERSHSPARKS